MFLQGSFLKILCTFFVNFPSFVNSRYLRKAFALSLLEKLLGLFFRVTPSADAVLSSGAGPRGAASSAGAVLFN